MIENYTQFVFDAYTPGVIVLREDKQQLGFSIKPTEDFTVLATNPVEKEKEPEGTLIYLESSKLQLGEKIWEVCLLSPDNWAIKVFEKNICFYLKSGEQTISKNEGLTFLLNKVQIPTGLIEKPIQLGVELRDGENSSSAEFKVDVIRQRNLTSPVDLIVKVKGKKIVQSIEKRQIENEVTLSISLNPLSSSPIELDKNSCVILTLPKEYMETRPSLKNLGKGSNRIDDFNENNENASIYFENLESAQAFKISPLMTTEKSGTSDLTIAFKGIKAYEGCTLKFPLKKVAHVVIKKLQLFREENGINFKCEVADARKVYLKYRESPAESDDFPDKGIVKKEVGPQNTDITIPESYFPFEIVAKGNPPLNIDTRKISAPRKTLGDVLQEIYNPKLQSTLINSGKNDEGKRVARGLRVGIGPHLEGAVGKVTFSLKKTQQVYVELVGSKLVLEPRNTACELFKDRTVQIPLQVKDFSHTTVGDRERWEFTLDEDYEIRRDASVTQYLFIKLKNVQTIDDKPAFLKFGGLDHFDGYYDNPLSIELKKHKLMELNSFTLNFPKEGNLNIHFLVKNAEQAALIFTNSIWSEAQPKHIHFDEKELKDSKEIACTFEKIGNTNQIFCSLILKGGGGQMINATILREAGEVAGWIPQYPAHTYWA